MISWINIGLLYPQYDQVLAEGYVESRNVVLVVLLVIYILLFIYTLRRLKESRIRKITAFIILAILILESAELIPFLQREKHVPLEYVCSVETTRNDPHNQKVRWYTSCFLDSTPEDKERLEDCLECDLDCIALTDKEYSYLFVLYYDDVDLLYSKWSEQVKFCDMETIFWVGRIKATGEPTENRIYIFRFPRKLIVPNDQMDLYGECLFF